MLDLPAMLANESESREEKSARKVRVISRVEAKTTSHVSIMRQRYTLTRSATCQPIRLESILPNGREFNEPFFILSGKSKRPLEECSEDVCKFGALNQLPQMETERTFPAPHHPPTVLLVRSTRTLGYRITWTTGAIR